MIYHQHPLPVEITRTTLDIARHAAVMQLLLITFGELLILGLVTLLGQRRIGHQTFVIRWLIKYPYGVTHSFLLSKVSCATLMELEILTAQEE